MIEVHWVKAPYCCGQIYHDEQHGVFETLGAAMESIRKWWDQNDFKPHYVRQMFDEYGDLWWDYGLHNAFYVLKEVSEQDMPNSAQHQGCSRSSSGQASEHYPDER